MMISGMFMLYWSYCGSVRLFYFKIFRVNNVLKSEKVGIYIKIGVKDEYLVGGYSCCVGCVMDYRIVVSVVVEIFNFMMVKVVLIMFLCV